MVTICLPPRSESIYFLPNPLESGPASWLSLTKRVWWKWCWVDSEHCYHANKPELAWWGDEGDHMEKNQVAPAKIRHLSDMQVRRFGQVRLSRPASWLHTQQLTTNSWTGPWNGCLLSSNCWPTRTVSWITQCYFKPLRFGVIWDTAKAN